MTLVATLSIDVLVHRQDIAIPLAALPQLTWKRLDVEVLTHCADDVVFSSPLAMRVVPESQGTVRGKQALRDYWNRALATHTDLHFTLVGVHVGVDTIAINYRTQRDVLFNEVLRFRDGGLSGRLRAGVDARERKVGPQADGERRQVRGTFGGPLIGTRPPVEPTAGVSSAVDPPQ